MKTIRLTILFLLFPLFFLGQTLTGLWTGTVSNDSASVRKDQAFEIVLTQYKDKVYGYSRSDFIVNDTLFYIVKRVTGTIEGDICEVKDDDIISYNFRGRLDKGVKMTSTFHFDHGDSTWKLDGTWKTNKTKKYYAVSGKIELTGEKDLAKSKLFPHLEELKLADDVAFYKESKKIQEPVATIKEPVKDKLKETKKEAIAQTKSVAEDVKKEKSVASVIKENEKEDAAIAQAKPEPAEAMKQPENGLKKDKPVKEETLITDKPQSQRSEPVVTTKQAEQKKDAATEPVNPEIKKQEVLSAAVVSKEKEKPIFTASVSENKPVIAPAAARVAERKVAPPQIVNFKSDSLELALYDNGEVDGDTVSVLLNGEVIIARQGLKVSAIKKTIHVSADSLTLMLYAENLGKYPPNTGLLVVHDGEETYQIRFSADLQQNAAVIFKRKRY